MLDRDLASLYEIETKVLNQAVKRHIRRFPDDFMFQLTKEEFEELRFQFEASESDNSSRSQIVTLKSARGQNLKYLPYAFTEQGVAMLSGVINSDKAISMPARLRPFGREYRYYAGFCSGKAGTVKTK